MSAEPTSIPAKGRPTSELLAQIDERQAEDLDWRSGKAFSLVYNPDFDDLEHLLEEVGKRFLHENALNPFKYPSLMTMELEIIAMACGLLNTEPNAGAVTSGGTESIFLAVQVARDQARHDRGIAEPQLLTASTAHPAFAKAAKYLDIEHILIPVGPDGRADVAAMTAAMGERTGLVVGSAPCYPFGLMDDIESLASAAAERSILFHTDACLGGWLLPWYEKLGLDVPPWDFRVPGVTSMSADIHKYGYAFKGASIVAYRSRDLLEKQFFWYDGWPGGLYASGTTAGTRPAAPIVGAWSAINRIGVDGYVAMARTVHDTFEKLRDGIRAIDGLTVTGEPEMSLFEFAADPSVEPLVDIGGVADVMDAKGWNLDRQQGGLHLMVSPYHAKIVDQFLADLAEAVATHDSSRGKVATYGGVV